MSVTIRTLSAMKGQNTRISMVTCYDATFARLVDEAAIDCILVGDSLGMVVKGEDNTLAVTVDEIAYHTRAVARGAKRAHIVADMPFLSYQASLDEAVKNAGKMLQNGAAAVKLEGGRALAPVVRRLVEAGIPVMGHIGLMPQSVHAQGGFVVQGRDEESRARILDDADALVDAGVYAMVLEGVPAALAREITERVPVPTIGIGAGASCDGQVLVLYDLLGLNPSFKPRFVKHFADGAGVVTGALRAYADEVKSGTFPATEHTFAAKPTSTAPRMTVRSAYGPVEPH
jgi:3-methyl-2-oxobutanoate hydroxymethyltransferase